MGRGSSSRDDPFPTWSIQNHVSAPLSSLRDPASFGPPPRHHSAAERAQMREVARGPPSYSIEDLERPPRLPPRPGRTPPRSKGRTPEAEDDDEEEPPPLPSRPGQTFPTPRVPPQFPWTKQWADEERPPLPGRSPVRGASSSDDDKQPNLGIMMVNNDDPSDDENIGEHETPPRLPLRPTAGDEPVDAPPAYTEAISTTPHINERATSRLGAAGVSVPSLGIGPRQAPQRKTPPQPPQSRKKPDTHGWADGGELQARFAAMRMRSGSGADDDHEETARQSISRETGTTSSTSSWPNSNSLGAAAGATRSALANGRQQLGATNERYGVTRRVGDFIERQRSAPSAVGPLHPAPAPMPVDEAAEKAEDPFPPSSAADAPLAVSRSSTTHHRTPPPPPPPKKPGLRGAGAGPPPPLPLATKPSR